MSEYLLQTESKNYKNAYCLFCYSEYEEKVAKDINLQCKGVYALPVLQEKHRSRKGVKTIVKEVMLPGYVFLFSEGALPMKQIQMHSRVLKFLNDSEGVLELYGENLEYARWVLNYNGLIGCSKAIRMGSRIKVLDGPLREYEGYIKEVSKKNRNARIEIMFMGQMISAWLPSEWVESNG